MSRLTSPTGVRVNRRPRFVAIDSKTIRDTTISYRALGLLGYILDQKEGWQVRSDQLSKGEGREGRGAVRTALRELAERGYYRLERRRLRTGKCVMGTAVSEYPVEQWIKDHEIFSTVSDPAVPVVEQEDGSFLVEYPDGTFGSDGFESDPFDNEEPPADPEPEPEPEDSGEEDEDTAEEPPAEPEKPPVRPRRTRRTSAQKAADDEQKAAEKKQKDEKKAALDAAVEAVAKWWWEDAEKHLGKYVGKTNGYLAMRGMVKKALEAGYTQRQCADALRHARKHLPSAQQWQTALGVATNHIVPSQPTGRIPYSDKATWGAQNDAPPSTPGDAPTPAADDSDDATFGVIARS
ncbi:hypothetical protein SAMN05216483_6728 [Streptomyces sp. 2131.1]|uniref:hypothetical protein n=1 Tax=Streptomyces sp. 2131.1 TaxID=1855346 RepID=UPI000897D537|nr:hypothetical protein [Streptomyces sp. 2131.1]SEE83862.1 hypothetical protein SAMN05216483_6728 [Streptomyces sp. 2131.1]